LALSAAAVLLLSLLGCTNPFKPADPEPPSGDAVIENFSTIEDLLNTMALAIQTRTPNGANAYIHAFAESTTTGQRAFRAYHDPAAKAAWITGSAGQSAPEPWLLLNEFGLHSELSRVRPNDAYFFKWDPDPGSPRDDEIATDVFAYHRHYYLYAGEGGVVIAAGFADLLIQKQGSRYSIFEWRDRVDPLFGVNPTGDQRSFTYYRLESQ
jgi:hypothetical protein